MKVHHFRLILTLPLLALLIAVIEPELRRSQAASATVQFAGPKPAQVLKVGITEYQNVEKAYTNYEKLFQQLAAVSDEPINFEFAIGNYGEVLEWYNRGDIDVAVLSAMPVAKLLLEAGSGDVAALSEAYVGDVSVREPPTKSEVPTAEIVDESINPSQKDSFTYRSVCLTLSSDPDLGATNGGQPRTITDLQRLWNNNSDKKPFKFLFVRPYSLSGYILPRYILSEYGINPTPDQMEFSYAHGKSLMKMLDESKKDPSKPKTRYVAFVLDGTNYPVDKDTPQHAFQQIKIDKLQNVNIPREKVFVNHNLDKDKFKQYKTLMKRLFDNWKNKDSYLQLRKPVANWQYDYEDSTAAVATVAVPRQLLYKTTISELLEDFARYVDQPNTDDRVPPRLALVLSGGGAKCAYQAGAIAAIEAKLRKINEGRTRPIDINLVVGTSGGAINALLVAAGVTKAKDATGELAGLWESFRQQQFFQPSRRFNLAFGLCFGLMQALLITVAVLIFGRHSVKRVAIALIVLTIVAVELGFAWYFGARWMNFAKVLFWQAVGIALTIAIVRGVGSLITSGIKNQPNRFGRTLKPFANDPHHWRLLTVVLMLGVSALEIVIAKCPGLDERVTRLSDNHWIDHGWMIVTLICNWSFPYPLFIGLLMAAVGAVIWRNFDWTRRRPVLVWAMSILLVLGAIGLVWETFFRASAPSKAQGIEHAFAEKLPSLIKKTVESDFAIEPPQDGESALQQISKKVMDPNRPMLQRDLVITTSRLPIDVSESVTQTQADLVNGLHDDLYFYFRANQDEQLKPPLDRRFIPLKLNADKLLDVVIGSSTIYPIFPSRVLTGVHLGNEEKQMERIERMSIVDGGYIHNIPIEAAVKWKASHIILIEASPNATQSTPKDFWDHSMTAFGYLFNQAQLTDKLVRGATETFELRPTSFCEKQDTLPSCVGAANRPEPDMDTFDFSPSLVQKAFDRGTEDVNGPKPLFMRVPGPPLFRSVVPPPATEARNRESKQATFAAHHRRLRRAATAPQLMTAAR